MEHMKLHHVGIVMTSQERADRFMEKMGFETDYVEYVEAYKADCLFTKHGDDETPIELVIAKEGVLTTYNNGKGGIHHIAFEVEDVEATRKLYEEKGLHMLEEQAVLGAGGIIVNFLRPRYGEGILTEFVQKIN
ncbi:MAG: VOC family protein [Hespellia sp.]|nr:VOC family protein [Hespellia sp.]